MPAKSKAQAKMMGADLRRAREGKKTRTGMTQAQLEEYASIPQKGLPAKKPASKPAPKGMHDMGGGHMMKDSEMKDMMSPELKQRYPTMVKKGRKK